MKLFVLGAASATEKDTSDLQKMPEFRKASKNMLLAFAAASRALKEAAVPNVSELSLVLGSSYGELEITRDFLVTLAQSGIARPLLFQNSLHNATSGFLALQLGIRGPSITVSNRYFTGEGCLEAAAMVLERSEPYYCLVVGVEGLVRDLVAPIQQNYPTGVSIVSGAGALVLANEAAAHQFQRIASVVIQDVQCSLRAGFPCLGVYYDSNAIELLADAIRTSASEVILPKPDGKASRIQWTKGLAK